MRPTEFLEIMHLTERMKDTIRHCTTSKGRPESVAEHSWRISLMAMLLRDEFPEADMAKVTEMCLIHDLGECFTGDIPTFLKTKSDEKLEARLLSEWVGSLPPELSARMRALYAEMDAMESAEAKIYKALDRFEAVIQHNESPISTWAENEYTLNRVYGNENAEFHPWLKALRTEMLRETDEKIALSRDAEGDVQNA
ncbi:MAG: HD domain-containing protein [Oscillospiraceae bacterium]|nr:HD domain-containing protein [Oscillospiraceae bacterium]